MSQSVSQSVIFFSTVSWRCKYVHIELRITKNNWPEDDIWGNDQEGPCELCQLWWCNDEMTIALEGCLFAEFLHCLSSEWWKYFICSIRQCLFCEALVSSSISRHKSIRFEQDLKEEWNRTLLCTLNRTRRWMKQIFRNRASEFGLLEQMQFISKTLKTG